MFYSLFFTVVFSLSAHADPKPHQILESNNERFNKLKSCYQDLQFSDVRLNTASRFLRDFDYTYSTKKDPSKFKKYQALVIPKKVNGKYVMYMIQPGQYGQYPYDNLVIQPYDKKKTPHSLPIGNTCELKNQYSLRSDHPEYRYFAFHQDHLHFNSTEKCGALSLGCQSRNGSRGFRLQMYNDQKHGLQFCEDTLKTDDQGKKSSNKRKGWHIEKKPRKLTSQQAYNLILDDLSKKIRRSQEIMKNIMSKSYQNNQYPRVSEKDIRSAYSAVSKNCKGFSPNIDKQALKFEEKLLNYDSNLNNNNNNNNNNDDDDDDSQSEESAS